MRSLVMISQKGGSGKTTLALHLAVAAERAGKTAAVIDLDPQASATSWKDLRQDSTPTVVSAQAARLEQVLASTASNGTALTIIDTAPHSESAALAAARLSDVVLIPCRPAILDLKAISISVDLARLAGKDPYVILNAVPPRGPLGEEAAQALAGYKVRIAPVAICHRAAYLHALARGETAQEYDPEGKAAEEIKQLYQWTVKLS